MTARRLAAHHLAVPSVTDHAWDSLQFKAIFAVSFAIYLVIALCARLAPSFWRADAPHRSILADACAGAGTTAQMAFAG